MININRQIDRLERPEHYQVLSSNRYLRAKLRGFSKQYSLGMALRSRLTKAISGQYGNKASSTTALVGASIDEVMKHLETLFVDGMNWDNYGKYGWHIDHIIPCKNFDLTKESEQKKCFHYTNLQPLWAKANLTKGAKIL